nr:putative reverse transcriptase domain-containing protein [Tanacetum cinerariifolium]
MPWGCLFELGKVGRVCRRSWEWWRWAGKWGKGGSGAWREKQEFALLALQLAFSSVFLALLTETALDFSRLRHASRFYTRDRVMLKVLPWKGVIRFGKRGKLSPRYIGPFKIMSRIDSLAYKLELSQELSGIHITFHGANLKKCLFDENLVIPIDEIKLDEKLHFKEEPVEIMDQEVKQLKQSRIPIVKVHCNSHRRPEYTWEREDQMRKRIGGRPLGSQLLSCQQHQNQTLGGAEPIGAISP